MSDLRIQLESYYDFKKYKKEYKTKNCITESTCILIRKEDMRNWKEFYEYNDSLLSDNSKLNELESKISIKLQYKQKPSFKILNSYNAIKTELSKGISIINKKFLSGAKYTPNSKVNEITCYFGNHKILLEFDELSYSHYFICKIGEKENTKYILLDKFKPYNKNLIYEIMEANKKELSNKTFVSHDSNFNIDVFTKTSIDKNKNNKKVTKKSINNNINNNNSFNNLNNNVKIESDISDNIIELMILMSGLEKDIKNKISNKDKKIEKFYLINFDWMKKFKQVYNYNVINNKLKKDFNYQTFVDFQTNIKAIIKDIKSKEIIKKQGNIDEIQIIPNLESINEYLAHFSKFSIVNLKIYNLIKTEFSYNNNNIFFDFNYYPHLYYKGNDFIEIGSFNNENMFVSEYYIHFSTPCHISTVLKEIKNNSTLDEYFKKNKINIKQSKTQEIKSNSVKVGEIININYSSSISNTNKNKPKTDIKIKNNNQINNNNINIINIKHNTNVKNKNISIKNNSNDIFKNKLPKPNIKINNFIKNNDSNNNKNKENNQINKNIEPVFKLNNKINDEEENEDSEESVESEGIIKVTNLKDIKYTPMIGLENIGQTCYMNAALQCFNNTDILVNYFINPEKKRFIKNNQIGMINKNAPQLSRVFKKLVKHLWTYEPNTSYSPYEFKRVVGEIDPLFKNFEANDAKDFVNFIILRLHEELNFVDNSFSNKSNLPPPDDNISPYNSQQVLSCYIYDFQMNLNSIISNIFYGTVQGEFECLNCKAQLYQAGKIIPNIKYNFQNYFFINFPLEEVRKFIVSNQMLYMTYMNMGINPNLQVNLIDCFKYYFRDEYMNGYCDRCGNNNAQILYRSKLFTIPTYLILLFNRGKGIQYNIKLNFPEYLNTNEIAINPNGMYQLYGVVKHFGDSSASGHFTAYCRSPINNFWYFYNDHAVTILNENEKYKIQDIGLTYILFYKRYKNK